MTESKQIVSDSGHWYEQDGSPAYTVIAKGNGLPRATNLGDARKLNLVPSVTTILKTVNKPFLIRWLQNQMLDACLEFPIQIGESVSDYKIRVWQEAERFSKERMEEGTNIHSAIDRGFLNGEDNIYFNAVKIKVDELYPNRLWQSEIPFASTHGFGGKCDLSSNKNSDGSDAFPIVIDYKSKEFADDAKAGKFIYDEHGMQLSAYGMGLFDCVAPVRTNIFVRPSDGVCLAHEHSDNNDADKFLALLEYWKIANKFDSSFVK